MPVIDMIYCFSSSPWLGPPIIGCGLITEPNCRVRLNSFLDLVLSPLDDPSHADAIQVSHRRKHERILHCPRILRGFSSLVENDTQIKLETSEAQWYGSESFDTGILV